MFSGKVICGLYLLSVGFVLIYGVCADSEKFKTYSWKKYFKDTRNGVYHLPFKREDPPNGRTSQDDDGLYLFDFTKNDDVDVWQEQSDTVRDVGMSKAIFVIHKNIGFRRAIFFALLNPQLNGAGFAGIRAIQTYNLTGHTKLQIQCRGQGQYNGFKVTLRHKGLNDEPNYSFEQYFQAPKDDFAIRNLKFSEFKAYYRGKRVTNNEVLDLSQITSLGIQMYGGVYQPVKQKGPATLEIDWIRAV